MLHLKCFLFYNYFKVSHSKASSLNDFLKTTGERKLIKILTDILLCRSIFSADICLTFLGRKAKQNLSGRTWRMVSSPSFMEAPETCCQVGELWSRQSPSGKGHRTPEAQGSARLASCFGTSNLPVTAIPRLFPILSNKSLLQWPGLSLCLNIRFRGARKTQYDTLPIVSHGSEKRCWSQGYRAHHWCG